jgi:hypothetical protein
MIHECKLPVCGSIFNNRNGRSMSLVDLLKPYQVLIKLIRLVKKEMVNLL